MAAFARATFDIAYPIYSVKRKRRRVVARDDCVSWTAVREMFKICSAVAERK
jgi:hypothetical protein